MQIIRKYNIINSSLKKRLKKEDFLMTWLTNNIGTVITFIILAAVIALIILRIKKDKAAGKSSCGCNCRNCALHGKCHGGR